MEVKICEDKHACGVAAAEFGAQSIRDVLKAKGHADIIVATGASQFEMLEALAAAPKIDWRRIDIFHLDEYVGLPEDHPAGFRRYLRERFISRLPKPPKGFYGVSAEAIPELNQALSRRIIDIAFVGIGENGHLAFNDPPADFYSTLPYMIVDLDEACRRQQLGEGWFAALDDVPRKAVTMSIRQIMKTERIINTVPDARKAPAVRDALEGPIRNTCPASVLRAHQDCHTFLDRDSAALLEKRY